CHRVTRYQPTTDKTMRLNAQTAIIENGFVYIPEAAPWLAEYLHELTVFPNGKHDDQVDSTAQFLDWFKRPMSNQGIFEYYRKMAGKLKPPEITVRLEAPPGIGAVQTFSGRRITIGEDRIVEMSAEDASCLIRAGWTKLADWSADEAALQAAISGRPSKPTSGLSHGEIARLEGGPTVRILLPPATSRRRAGLGGARGGFAREIRI